MRREEFIGMDLITVMFGWADSYFSLPWGYHELMGDIIGGVPGFK